MQSGASHNAARPPGHYLQAGNERSDVVCLVTSPVFIFDVFDPEVAACQVDDFLSTSD